MRYVIATAAVLVLTAGCGGGDGSANAEPTPAVSKQTTCDQVFLDGGDSGGKYGWWSRATSLIAARDGSIDDGEAAAVAEQLETIAATAKPGLSAHLEIMAGAAEDPKAADVDDYELSAREVANVCTAYVALDF